MTKRPTARRHGGPVSNTRVAPRTSWNPLKAPANTQDSEDATRSAPTRYIARASASELRSALDNAAPAPDAMSRAISADATIDTPTARRAATAAVALSPRDSASATQRTTKRSRPSSATDDPRVTSEVHKKYTPNAEWESTRAATAFPMATAATAATRPDTPQYAPARSARRNSGSTAWPDVRSRLPWFTVALVSDAPIDEFLAVPRRTSAPARRTSTTRTPHRIIVRRTHGGAAETYSSDDRRWRRHRLRGEAELLARSTMRTSRPPASTSRGSSRVHAGMRPPAHPCVSCELWVCALWDARCNAGEERC